MKENGLGSNKNGFDGGIIKGMDHGKWVDKCSSNHKVNESSRYTMDVKNLNFNLRIM